MNATAPEHSLQLLDYAPAVDTFLDDVLAGLARPQKALPCKYFYDAQGSRLFDAICELEEYYPTRTEMAIMQRHAADMAEHLGPGCLLVEYGSGSSLKTRILLDHLREPAAYVPIDISGAHLLASARALQQRYPRLAIHPVCADYTAAFELPAVAAEKVVVYFPGSTIGNFDRDEAAAFLARMRAVCGPGGHVLIGVDLQKDVPVLEAAYDDARGVTAAFNLNLLRRINRELGGTFDLGLFAHRAVWNAEAGCIEMHLVAVEDHTVRVGARAFTFRAGETILTERSYKYTLAGFSALAGEAGFRVDHVWTDDRLYFSVQLLTALT